VDGWEDTWLAIQALIQWQRQLASSVAPAERFHTLWVAALLDQRLSECRDYQIGAAIVLVQEHFSIFEPEFAICEYAKLRLLDSPTAIKELL
jgi:hypothetical protein